MTTVAPQAQLRPFNLYAGGQPLTVVAVPRPPQALPMSGISTPPPSSNGNSSPPPGSTATTPVVIPTIEERQAALATKKRRLDTDYEAVAKAQRLMEEQKTAVDKRRAELAIEKALLEKEQKTLEFERQNAEYANSMDLLTKEQSVTKTHLSKVRTLVTRCYSSLGYTNGQIDAEVKRSTEMVSEKLKAADARLEELKRKAPKAE